jgi:predicted transcriptional regulator
MKMQKSQYPEIDLTGVLPNRLTTGDAEELALYIERYKALQKTIHVYQAVVRFLKNGKLTVEEIAECLNLPPKWILNIQKDLIIA